MSFKIDLNSLQNSLLNLETKKDRAIRVYAETSAKKLESDAKMSFITLSIALSELISMLA